MKRSLSALRSFYRYLMRMGLGTADPAHKIVNPKADKPLPVFVKEAEMNRLFDEVKFPEGFVGMRDYLILLTFYSTGMRVAELEGLDVEALSFERSELRVTGKRNKQRVIPFGQELAMRMHEYLAERSKLPCGGGGALFVSPDGKRLAAAEVRVIVKQYLSLVTSQKRRGPHVLRHTFATVMLNNGAELEAVKELLGHESLATTEVYTHTTFAELRKEYEKAHPRAEGDTILKKNNSERISSENLEKGR
jgi:integrase/recombinase XerC